LRRADLVRRIYDIDMRTCPHCGRGTLEPIATILDPEAVASILADMGCVPQPGRHPRFLEGLRGGARKGGSRIRGSRGAGDQEHARPVRVYAVMRDGGMASAPHAVATLDRPFLALLPFANLSGDPDQEYFVDGMVDELITTLSRIKWFFVIARGSSFTYKGKSVDVKTSPENLPSFGLAACCCQIVHGRMVRKTKAGDIGAWGHRRLAATSDSDASPAASAHAAVPRSDRSVAP
jgi:hypothetical protein